MSKSKKTAPLGNTVIIGLFAVALVANLFFAIFTMARVNRLHVFYDTFSADYRSLSGGGQAQAPIAENPPAPVAEAPAVNCVDGTIDMLSDPSIGDPNAPVTIVEYSDFECPFCARFITGAYPRIKSEYVETGKVRIIFKDFPLDHAHPLAIPAALTANCVAQELGDQAFFAYHDRIFLQQSALSQSNITAWAKDFGLSEQQINACLNDSVMLDEIFADRAEGTSLGINGTPSFVINGELVVGAQPFEVFQQSIENALAGGSCEG